MKKIKAVIIDDEIGSIEVISILLERHCPNIELKGFAENVDDGIALIEKEEPHLVFLDIEMPGQNGFQLLHRIKAPNFYTIVVTGYEEHAIEAIRNSAIDFLLKPIRVKELIGAVEKVNLSYLKTDPRTEHLFELLSSPQKRHQKIVIPSHSGFKSIELSAILYLKGMEGGYSIIKENKTGEVLATKALSYFETLLDSEKFIRIHRSYVVNLDAVKSFDSKTGEATLKDSSILPVATRKRTQFRAAFIKK